MTNAIAKKWCGHHSDQMLNKVVVERGMRINCPARRLVARILVVDPNLISNDNLYKRLNLIQSDFFTHDRV